MMGRKRLAQSDPNLDNNNNDSAFGSKRVMAAAAAAAAASPFDGAQPPALDAQRARQHVRALNTQFASWVQSQLQNHPDELWEDGVQDYQTHASSIMEKFSNVVEWLKANAAKAGSAPSVGPWGTENKSVFGTKNNEDKFQLPKKSGFTQMGSMPSFAQGSSTPSFAQGSSTPSFSLGGSTPSFAQGGSAPRFGQGASTPSFGLGASTPSFGEGRSTPVFGQGGSTSSVASSWSSGTPYKSETSVFGQGGPTSSFASSWSSGAPYKSQTSVMFGGQNSAPISHNASEDPDQEDEPEQPSSPSVKKTEEKGILVVHEVKCKLYVKSIDPVDKEAWKDRGMGQLSIKCKEGVNKATKESKPTVVVRNDVGKVLLNALIYPGIQTNLMKNAIAAIFHTSGDASGNDVGTNDKVVARTYLIRTKTEDDRNNLANAIKEYAPAC